jgi:hypothetical protein
LNQFRSKLKTSKFYKLWNRVQYEKYFKQKLTVISSIVVSNDMNLVGNTRISYKRIFAKIWGNEPQFIQNLFIIIPKICQSICLSICLSDRPFGTASRHDTNLRPVSLYSIWLENCPLKNIFPKSDQWLN